MSLDSALFLLINGSTSSPHALTLLALFATQHLPQLLVGGTVGVFFVGDRPMKQRALQVLGAMALAWLLAKLGQHFIPVDRPFTLGLGVQLLPHTASHSFPSSHASTAFAFATVVALTIRKVHWTLLALIAAGLIAWSRVYLGLHFPSDVLAGAVLGAGCAWFVCWIRPKRKAKPVFTKAST